MSINWFSHPVSSIEGEMAVAGDKSISHRAIMLGSLAQGQTNISGFLEGEDCLATLRAFEQMGVPIEHHGEGKVSIQGQGLYGLSAPANVLDVGNSGTSMRLMCGVLAGQSFASTLTGDASLLKRPMRRVTDPLRQMGANITTTESGTAPIHITGQALHGIRYEMPVASAQLKSCLLLAGLYAKGTTTIIEHGLSRDHSERMLKGFGVQLDQRENELSIEGGQQLQGTDIIVPGDVSSAAFFIVAALIAKEAEVLITNVGINPTRAAVIDILQAMGGDITLLNQRNVGGEPVADIKVCSSELTGIDIPTKYVPIAIDEFPIIFVAAAYANGQTIAREVGELRVKESDRLLAMEQGLTTLGIHCQSKEDYLLVEGGDIGSGEVESFGDHRIAMSFAIAAIGAQGPIQINDCANVATSFPTFLTLARALGMHIQTTK